ncbi:hypothetical protein [Daejeonella sp.]|uniref:hypothetical protein n=1 Tax=Daejeonella sp. TaxID=2805397 RepID=UPI0025C6CDE7|nr:hypothetical protein [Daejeonella sp.]
MKKIIGLITVLLITVGVFAYLYFSNLHVDSRNNTRLLSEIPSDASLILQFQHEQDLFDILNENTLFDTIAGPQKKAEIGFLRKFIAKNTFLEPLTKNQLVFLSFHPSNTNGVHYLWSINTINIQKKDDIIKLLNLNNEYKLKELKENGLSIFRIETQYPEYPFYFIIDQGIARGSSNKDLLLRSVNKKSTKINSEFIKIINEGIKKDENALVNLFINYNKRALISPFLKRTISGNFALFESFSGYSSLTLNYKKDALMFNGESRLEPNQGAYIKLFLNQSPVKNSLKQIIPYNTANSIIYGLSNFKAYQSDLRALFKENKELEKLGEQMKKITLETGLNPDRDIQKLWGNEFSIIQLSTFENLAIIKLKNGTQMQFFMEILSSSYSENIKKMNYGDIFYYYWGEPLKKYVKPFYMIQDNLLILSNSPGTLQRYVKDYNSNRFLVNMDTHKQFDQYVSDQSNISFLLHFSNSGSLLQDLLKRNYAGNFGTNKSGISDLYAFSYQLTSNKSHFLTNIYTGYKSSTIQESVLNVDSLDIN